ncbi:hypothetical protein Tco_1370256 [Tanacetum coccineum]
MVVVLWGCRWGWCEGGGGSGCDDEDGVGGVVMKPVRGGDGEARGGACEGGSNRSEDGEHYWSWPEKSAGKVFRRRQWWSVVAGFLERMEEFLNKYCPPGRTTKKMEEINNFQQEPDETLYQAWERFKELLMKCPQHYFTEMQEVILFYNGLDVPTR